MADTNYKNDEFFLSFLVDHPVISDTKPAVVFFCAGQFDDIVFQGIGIFSKDKELFFDNFLKRYIDSLQVLDSLSEEFKRIHNPKSRVLSKLLWRLRRYPDLP